VTHGIGFFEMVLIQLLGLGGLIGGGGLPTQAEDLVLSKAAPAECLFYANWAEIGTAGGEAVSQDLPNKLLRLSLPSTNTKPLQPNRMATRQLKR